MKNYRTTLLCAAFAFLCAFSPHTANASDRPNIIFILADDMGYGDLSCYGAEKFKTPNIDRLAEEGILFTDGHCGASTCTPTRYGLMTGRHPWRSWCKYSALSTNAPLLIEEDRVTIASFLKSAGYSTSIVGKWHLGYGHEVGFAKNRGDTPPNYWNTRGSGPDWNGELKPGPLENGFDYAYVIPVANSFPPYVFVENYRVAGLRQKSPIGKLQSTNFGKMEGGEGARWTDEELIDRFANKLVSQLESLAEKQKPFFLYYTPTQPHIGSRNRKGQAHWPCARFKGTSEAGPYGDVVQELDWSVGEILKTLDRLGLTENTLVIFTSDNGGYTRQFNGHRPNGPILRGGKGDLVEGGIRVPFLAKWPSRIKPGTRSKETISTTDMLATFAAIIGKDLPDGAGPDSYNVLPALLGQKLPHPERPVVLSSGGTGALSIRAGKWKLIDGQGNCGYGEFRNKRPWPAPKPGDPPAQLYNLEEDLGERNNLYLKHPEIVHRLKAGLEKIKADENYNPTELEQPKERLTIEQLNALFANSAELLPSAMPLVEDHSWPLDSAESPNLSVHGDITNAPGVEGNSVVFDGASVLRVKDSKQLTGGEAGFTLTAWVNPYLLGGEQQMIAAKNRYSLGERQWGVMIDKDNRFRLYVRQCGWATADCSTPPKPGHWHLIGVVVRAAGAELWVNGKLEGELKLRQAIPQTKAPLTFGGIDDDGRIWQNFSGAIDEIRLFDKPLDAKRMSADYKAVKATHKIPAQPEPFTLWTGPPIPDDVEKIPFVKRVEHRTIHLPSGDGYKFLHGAAIVEYKGMMYVNWANSPTNENGPHETLHGRRSKDGGVTWSELEVIGPGFEGKERHSHGVLFVHKGKLWTICARFGVGTSGRRFAGLQGEAFVLDEQTDRWKSRGIVMKNCWPYDEPVRMSNGNFITGGQDKDGLPVVAISHGDDLTKWDSQLIPYDPRMKPSFAETSVWAEGERVIAVIRGGGGVAWVSTSDDYGRTWSKAVPSNLPMPRAKAYLGKLSTGQLYLLSNLVNRDTLVISVSQPGKQTLSRMLRIRHGKSIPPRFPGAAKGKQWSYPYGYEHDNKLFVVYSIGKENCGLSVLPIESLAAVKDQGGSK